MSINGETEVLKVMSKFTACLRDYLSRRLVPPLWVYCHEVGKEKGWHTHFAIFLPVETESLRTEIMTWLRGWPLRQFGRRMPHAVRQRVPRAHSELLHWLIFGYLLKGCDPKAVVQSARNSPDGLPVMLHELVAHQFRDPGIMTFRKRVGCSQYLDHGHQERGVPASWNGVVPMPKAVAGPFRSTFDDGIIDVRRLYGQEFCDWINGSAPREAASNSLSPDEILSRVII